ncbi:hypothetical protein SCLCIDRAFT_71135, partial [Scleroderma citrinum Foug A]
LRTFELTDNEWGVLEQLHSILKDATLYFSCSTPNLATVIPVMDHIHQELSKYSHDKKYVRSIHAGISLAKETLNRYYSCTDESEVYCIAMVLHPRHKLSYFKTARWEDEWITTAENLVRDGFSRSY